MRHLLFLLVFLSILISPTTKGAEIISCSKLFRSLVNIHLSENEILDTLYHGEVVDIQRFQADSRPTISPTYIVTFKNNDIRAIAKPDVTRVGTKSLQVNPYSEQAAYAFDRLLGFDLVPPTIVREMTLPGVPGGAKNSFISLQYWIDGARIANEVAERKIKPMEYAKLRLFDLLIQNNDRNGTNYLVNSRGIISAIDNGGSFNGRGQQNWVDFQAYTSDSIRRFFLTEQGALILEKIKVTSIQQLKDSLPNVPDEMIEITYQNMERVLSWYNNSR